MHPDFFLVGAPRSGTTALCNYLRTHPELFVSSPKEPTFFGRDLTPKRFATKESYLSLFEGVEQSRRAGDGSVAYLSSDFAAEEIHAFNASASILMVLRNPVDVIHSLHRKHYLMGIEPCRKLEDALAAETDRLRGDAGVPSGVCGKVIALRNRATYAPRIEKFLDLFGPSRVRMFLFDDFQANPARVFVETCRFLDVRDDVPLACTSHNVGRQVKCAGWHEFLTRTPRWAQMLMRVTLPSPEWRNRLHKFLIHHNQSTKPCEPLSPALRARLRQECSADIAALEKLTGWDLAHWRR